nr:ArmA_Rmt [uncultured bacterium]
MSEIAISKKYRDICPDTVARVFAAERAKYKSEKDADKAARAHLHQITGAFMTPDEMKTADKLLRAYKEGDGEAFEKTLRLHSSTRERMEGAQALYEHILNAADSPKSVLDLACGLNPLILGNMGLTVRGMDISGGCVRLVNEWARVREWNVQADCRDLLCNPEMEKADIAFMMKLRPVLEQQKKGSAMELVASVPTDMICVTFPMKTLGGRKVGMEKHYSEWFEGNLPHEFEMIERFIEADELCYVARRCV